MVWSDDDVKAFIAGQLNVYGFEASAEQSKQGTSPWKRWLWLEKHGFDFAYQSLEREIFSFRMNENPSGALRREERLLLLSIRDVMRRILALDPLTNEERDYLLSVAPIGNWTHWSTLPRPLGPADADPQEGEDYSDIVGFAWDFMKREKPEYISLLRLIRAYENDNAEAFDDPYTMNGSYTFHMSGPRTVMYTYVANHFIRRSYDLFIPPGNLKLQRLVSARFYESIDELIKE